MGYRAHIHKKHEIEYGNCHFNWHCDVIHDWLTRNGVDVSGGGECGEIPDWEMSKDQLREIPESAFADIEVAGDWTITAEQLRAFVRDILAAPTGDYAYLTWL